MEEHPEDKKYPSPEEYLETIRDSRMKLRILLKQFMEEELGKELSIEDDLSGVLKAMPKEQQQSVYGKLQLHLQFGK